MLTIIKWLSVNKLSLNVDKTKILIFDHILTLKGKRGDVRNKMYVID